jgi:hypothetical protein
MTKVQEQPLCNGKVCNMFYSIPCIRNMIAARQMDFVGKMIRIPPDCPSRNMITACCDHKRQVGRPQMTGKNFMIENLRLLFLRHPNCPDQLKWLPTQLDSQSIKQEILVPTYCILPHLSRTNQHTGDPCHLGRPAALPMDLHQLKKYAHGYLPSLPIFYVFAEGGSI